MGLLDTYVKLQALKNQQARDMLDQVHSVLYLSQAMKQMSDLNRNERVNTAMAGVPTDITTESPMGVVGMEEGYDVADPTRMTTSSVPKTDEQYIGDLVKATSGIDPATTLSLMTQKRAASKERETEERRRRENPIVPFNFRGMSGEAALSNVGPLVEKEAALQQKTDAATMLEEYRRDKLDSDRQFREAMLSLKQNNQQLPKPPLGYRYTEDNDLEPIPGGKEDAKRRADYAKQSKMVSGTTSGLVKLKEQAEKLRDHKGLVSITGVAGSFPNMPGSKAADAEALLTQLKSRTSLDVLQNIRSISPTGGALGNVSDAEGKRLETYIAALEKAQSPQAMKAALNDIVNYSVEAVRNLKEGFSLQFSDRDRERYGGKLATKGTTETKGKTVVERRRGKNGKVLVKYSDGTIGEE